VDPENHFVRGIPFTRNTNKGAKPLSRTRIPDRPALPELQGW
jgi:hypothetical protein